MRKVLLFILAFILLSTAFVVYAEDSEYSEWSTESKGYSREEKAIQYGVITPKRWSEWSLKQATNEIDLFFQKEHDFGNNHYSNDKNTLNWSNANEKSLYIWNFDEPQYISKVYVDVDCCHYESDTDYVSEKLQPEIKLYVDDKFITKSKPTTDLLENWLCSVDLIATKVEIKMSSAAGNNRNLTVLYGATSYVSTKRMMYSHVIEWNEPSNWVFDTPYQLIGGEKAQKPAERTVYRYPLNPVINVQGSVLYEDSSFEYIKDLATATDYDDKDITELIEIIKFEYLKENEQGEYIVYETIEYPKDFNPALGDKLRVTYFVENELGCTCTKVVTMVIIKTGVIYDLKIYDRYISKDYLYTLDKKSKWLNDKHKQKLDEAFNWLERK